MSVFLPVVALLAAAPAQAATVSASTRESGDEVQVNVVYRSAGAIPDRVRLTFEPGGVRLRAASVRVGRGCARRRDRSILCAGPPSARYRATLWTGAGNDRIRVDRTARRPASTGINLELGSGEDTVKIAPQIGQPGDAAIGGAGDDTLAGPIGLYGGAGNDRLAGRDYTPMVGGSGRDELRGWETTLVGDGPNRPGAAPAAPADDLLIGAGQDETASYSDRQQGVHVDLTAGVGGTTGEHDVLRGIEDITGGSGDDVLVGDGADKWLFGSGGRDWLIGGAGHDILQVQIHQQLARVRADSYMPAGGVLESIAAALHCMRQGDIAPESVSLQLEDMRGVVEVLGWRGVADAGSLRAELDQLRADLDDASRNDAIIGIQQLIAEGQDELALARTDAVLEKNDLPIENRLQFVGLRLECLCYLGRWSEAREALDTLANGAGVGIYCVDLIVDSGLNGALAALIAVELNEPEAVAFFRRFVRVGGEVHRGRSIVRPLQQR